MYTDKEAGIAADKQRDDLAERLEAISQHRSTARVRMTLDLSFRLNEMVEDLASDKHTSKADIIRFAIEFLAMAQAAKDAGMQIGAWSDKDGKRIEREFIGL